MQRHALRGSLFVKLGVLGQIANSHSFLALDGTSVRLVCVCIYAYHRLDHAIGQGSLCLGVAGQGFCWHTR